MLKALLVDDEKNNIENLQFLLENDCKGITVIGTAHNGISAREWLANNDVDVVFLDISMPLETGIEMLQKLPDRTFKVIFVTAHNEYALQAIKASAVDYLLKPVNIAELQVAVGKLTNTIANTIQQQNDTVKVNHFVKNYVQGQQPSKIAIPQLGGISFLNIDEIVVLQADSNYTIIHKNDMQKVVVTKTLKDFEEMLSENDFIRIHKSYIVHVKYIMTYSSIDGGMVTMTDGNVWSVSRRQIDVLLAKLKEHNILFFK